MGGTYKAPNGGKTVLEVPKEGLPFLGQRLQKSTARAAANEQQHRLTAMPEKQIQQEQKEGRQ